MALRFRIKWLIRRRFDTKVVDGLSRYGTVEAAEKQAGIWKRLFPENRYFVEPVMESA